MFYSNGNYMQDLNYYNQYPNNNFMTYMPNNTYQNAMPTIVNRQQNLTAMYPAVYRIIAPVANQVLSNSNTSYLTEDSLNNLVDMVFDIVEKDINLSNQTVPTSSQAIENSNQNNNPNTSNTNNNRQQISNNSISKNNNINNEKSLLKDMIKIILLNEISRRNQFNNSQIPINNSNIFPNNGCMQSMYM